MGEYENRLSFQTCTVLRAMRQRIKSLSGLGVGGANKQTQTNTKIWPLDTIGLTDKHTVLCQDGFSYQTFFPPTQRKRQTLSVDCWVIYKQKHESAKKFQRSNFQNL